MPRPLREDYEGAWHHVMNRGAGRAAIFRADVDKSLFLDCIVESFERHKLQLHAYAMMDTHYHLLACSTTTRLSDAMRFASGRFTRLKNKRDVSDGPMFRGRFNSVAIETDAHLIQASRYIHLNPVEAGVVKHAQDWPWSSASAYLGLIAKPKWLEISLILDMFGPVKQVDSFRRHLDAGNDVTTREFYASL